MSSFNPKRPILGDLPFPILTPRLLIRPPMPGDGPALNQAVIETYDSLKDYLSWAANPPTQEESETYVRQGAANWILRNNLEPFMPLFIFDKQTNQFLGATGYTNLQWHLPRLEATYWLRDSSRGQGYMSEALQAVIQYAFDVLKIAQVNISCDTDNTASHKIAERLGFKREAVIKFHRAQKGDDEKDTIIYSRSNLDGLPDLKITY